MDWTACETAASSNIQDHVKVLIQPTEGENEFRVVAKNLGEKRLIHVKWCVQVVAPSEARIIVPPRKIVKTTSNWKTPTGGIPRCYTVYEEGDRHIEVYFHPSDATAPNFDLDTDHNADGQVKFRMWLPASGSRELTLKATLRAIPDIEGETMPGSSTFTVRV
ncbi:MAG: hypothetical protein DWQ04_12070 [Chloroflexi bacterium]|nr:MAG: hypothetical protein DWQ04_12070 [Chloroflexota bacterium]